MHQVLQCQHMDVQHGGDEHRAATMNSAAKGDYYTYTVLNKLSYQHITVSSSLLIFNEPICFVTWFLIQSF